MNKNDKRKEESVKEAVTPPKSRKPTMSRISKMF